MQPSTRSCRPPSSPLRDRGDEHMLRFSMPVDASSRGATSCQACACGTAHGDRHHLVHTLPCLLDVSMQLTAGIRCRFGSACHEFVTWLGQLPSERAPTRGQRWCSSSHTKPFAEPCTDRGMARLILLYSDKKRALKRRPTTTF